MKRRNVILTACMVLLALAVLVIAKGTVPGARRGNSRQRNVGAPLQATSLELERGADGSMVRYALDFSSVANLDAKNENNQSATMTIKVRGTVRATLAEATATSQTYEMVIENPSLDLGAALAPELVKELETGLGAPHYAVFKRTGQLEEILVPPATDATTYRLWFGLASGLQFTAGEGEEWTASELDPAGEYLAEYVTLDPDHFEKRKLRYLRLRGESSWIEEGKLTLGLDGLINVSRDDQRWPVRIAGEETAWTETAEQLIAMRVVTRLDLRRVELGKAPDGSAERLVSLKASLVRSVRTQTNADGSALPADFDALATLLRDKSVDPAFLIERFVVSFKSDPTAIDAAVALIKSEPETDPTFALAAALGQLGNDAAQAALVELATNDSVGSGYAEEALVELGRTEKPNAASIKTLRSALDDKRKGRAHVAALALGNAADSAQSVELVAALARRLSEARAPCAMAYLLLALGNTARATAYEPIARYIGTPDAGLRGTAAMALRLIPHDEAQPALARLLGTDPDVTVRASAAAAISYRTSATALTALSAAIRTDAAPAVRSEALASLAKLARSQPEARAEIAWAAANEADPKVKSVAENLL